MSNIEDRYAILQEIRKRIEDTTFRQIQSSFAPSSGIDLILEKAKDLIATTQMQSIKQSLDVLPVFSNALSEMCTQLASLQLGAIPGACNTVFELCSRISTLELNNIAHSSIVIPHDMAEYLSTVLDAAKSYLPEDSAEEYAEIVQPSPDTRKAKILTFDRAVTLLGLLVSLYTLIVTLLPHPQLTKIAEQNERLIAIEEERLELDRQQTERLEDIADNLSDIIIYLGEQIEPRTEQTDILSDRAEDTDNLDIPPSQDTQPDSQYQDTDTEN